MHRIFHAFKFSLQGFRFAWHEPAFQQEVVGAAVLLPLAFYLGNTWVEIALLGGSWLLVLIVEVLNTAIESVVDRVGSDWHDLSKRAKDLGSAAVLLSLLLSLAIWIAAIYQRFLA